MVIFCKFHTNILQILLKILYQTNILLKIIDFSLIKQLNDLNRVNQYSGHVAEWLRRGLQRPYVNREFPYKQYNKVRLQVQVQPVGRSCAAEIKKVAFIYRKHNAK